MVRADSLCAGFRSSAIPHFGQVPGLSLSTPSHIGQKYFFADLCPAAAACSAWLQEGSSGRPATFAGFGPLSLSNFLRQCSEQKKKVSAPRSTLPAAFSGSTSIPQIGSRIVSFFWFKMSGNRVFDRRTWEVYSVWVILWLDQWMARICQCSPALDSTINSAPRLLTCRP